MFTAHWQPKATVSSINCTQWLNFRCRSPKLCFKRPGLPDVTRPDDLSARRGAAQELKSARAGVARPGLGRKFLDGSIWTWPDVTRPVDRLDPMWWEPKNALYETEFKWEDPTSQQTKRMLWHLTVSDDNLTHPHGNFKTYPQIKEKIFTAINKKSRPAAARKHYTKFQWGYFVFFTFSAHKIIQIINYHIK